MNPDTECVHRTSIIIIRLLTERSNLAMLDWWHEERGPALVGKLFFVYNSYQPLWAYLSNISFSWGFFIQNIVISNNTPSIKQQFHLFVKF